MNNIEVFNSPEFGTIRTVSIDNEPWFVGKDVAEILGYGNTRDALAVHVDEEDRSVIQKSENTTLDVPNRGLTIINESGLYSLIFGSKLESARRFKRWVTSEVLPAIRKTGAYETDLAKKIRLTEKANKMASEVTEELLPYLKEALREKFNPVNRLPQHSAKMIIDDRGSKEKIDDSMKAFAIMYNYFADNNNNGKTVAEVLALPEYSWMDNLGKGILTTAQYFGYSAGRTRLDEENNDYLIFPIHKIRNDGKVTIPKIGTFSLDQNINIGTEERITSGVVKRQEDNNTYTFTVNCKQRS